MFPVKSGWASLACVFLLPTSYYVLVQSIPLPDPSSELDVEQGPYFMFLLLAMAPAGLQPYTIMEAVTGIRVTAVWPNLLWTFVCMFPAIIFLSLDLHVPVFMIAIAGATWNTFLTGAVYILAQRQVPDRDLKPFLFPYVALLTLQDSYFFMCFFFMIFFSLLSSTPWFQILGLIVFQAATHFVFKGAGLNFILRRLAPRVPNIDHIRATVILFYEFLAELFLSFSFPKVESVWVLVFASVCEVCLFTFTMARFLHPDPPEDSFFVKPQGEAYVKRKGMMNSHDAWIIKLRAQKKAIALEQGTHLDDLSVNKASSKGGRKHGARALPYQIDSLPGSANPSLESSSGSSADDGGRGAVSDSSSSRGDDHDGTTASSHTTSTSTLTSESHVDMSSNSNREDGKLTQEEENALESIDPARDVRVVGPSFFCLLVFENYAVLGFIAFYSNYCWGVNKAYYEVASACHISDLWVPFTFSLITASLHIVAFLVIRHRVRKIHHLDPLKTGLAFLKDNEFNSMATMCCCYVISTYFFLAHIDTFDFLSKWIAA